MSASSSIPTAVLTLWQRAVRDASLDEAKLHLLAGIGSPLEDMPPSAHLQPGKTLNPEAWADLFDLQAISEANLVDNSRRQRIGIRCSFDHSDRYACAVVLGLLRHEVEHALQYDGSNSKQLYALDQLAQRVADARDGGGKPTHYRLKPTERSANAAAAALLLRECPAVVESLAETDVFAPLATPQLMISLDELPRLTVEFVATYGQDLDRRKLFGDIRSWRSRLENAYAGAGAWWSELVPEE